MKRTVPNFIVFFWVVIIATAFSCWGTPILAEDTVQIQLDPSKVLGVIKPQAIGGINVNNAMMIIKVKDMIDPLRIPTITYPAGNVGDDPDKDVYSDAALKVFKQQQKLLGMPFTFFQVRLFNSTPKYAADTVKRVIANGIRVDVWTIGNEADLYGSARGDKSWTPEKYAKVFREYAVAMRAVKPDIKLAGPAVSQPKSAWIEPFIYECGDIVDVLAWHWYPTSPGVPDDWALDTASQAPDIIQSYRNLLKDPKTNPKGYQRDIQLAITEYAIHWDSNSFRHLTDMVGAMWTAEVLGYFGLSGLNYSHYFCLGAYGGHALFEIPPSYMERPVYYVFLFYANHFGKKMISAVSSDPLVKTFASLDEKGRLHVLLINEHPDTAETAVIASTDDKIQATNPCGWVLTESRSGEKFGPDELRTADGKVLATLPPYSVAVVDF